MNADDYSNMNALRSLSATGMTIIKQFARVTNARQPDSITIECSLAEGDHAKVLITDPMGRIIYNAVHDCGGIGVRVDGLAEGVYFCVLSINGKSTLQKKILILK